MKNVPDTPVGRLYSQHIHHVENQEIEALMNQYTDDCVLISSFTKTPLYYRGKEQLREHLNGILDMKGLVTEVAFYSETENPQTLMVTEKITTIGENGEEVHMRFADSWVLRDGKIAIHFAGMVQYSDGSLA
ncbi:nuclear transport factor 2 family protein [Clostridium cellulovorans]|uniref:SnoaL-like domain-containing protein n=1 Tax=Clostridium cellulovorans (strain ATCC 35296 / DSM 3052 / OCM 3 / 743B) TaxID=573061 RepID=D9SQF1_CLOC7|nr:nuclear transport factor 2 family protein [Clostridium cellulovorans]ADL50218.1 hypothetical protein Clocel_0441 [Clostridium cellulovorans 743B]